MSEVRVIMCATTRVKCARCAEDAPRKVTVPPGHVWLCRLCHREVNAALRT